MVMDGLPSLTSRPKASERLEGEPATRQGNFASPYTGNLKVAITYYFFDFTPLDVDNIPKPILDALKGLVY